MNIFFLLASILLFFLSIAHAIWGEKFIIKELNDKDISNDSKTGVAISWHQITFLLFLSGVAFGFLSFNNTMSFQNLLSLFLLILIAGNFLLFIALIIFKKHISLLSKSLPQIVLFSLLILFIILGIILF